MIRLWVSIIFLALLPAGSPSIAIGGQESPPAPTHFLTGRLLIATPALKDPRFYKSVVYIVRHDRDGALGLIVNRTLGRGSFAKFLQGFGLKSEGAGGTFPLRFGGPVEQGRVFILYQEGSIAGGEDKEIKITADLEMLKSMARGEGPKRKLILLGYAGWGAGQLESEIASDDWVTAPLDADLVFAPDDAPKWDAAMKNAGRLL